MSEKLHRHPIPICKNHDTDNHTWNKENIMFIIFDPIEDPVTCIWHKNLTYNHGIRAWHKQNDTKCYQHIPNQLICLIAFILCLFNQCLEKFWSILVSRSIKDLLVLRHFWNVAEGIRLRHSMSRPRTLLLLHIIHVISWVMLCRFTFCNRFILLYTCTWWLIVLCFWCFDFSFF